MEYKCIPRHHTVGTSLLEVNSLKFILSEPYTPFCYSDQIFEFSKPRGAQMYAERMMKEKKLSCSITKSNFIFSAENLEFMDLKEKK